MDQNLFFLIFYVISLSSAILVIISKNPLHSVIYLILVFCNIVFILLLLELEFISMVFLIVYIGAIAVLFLFIIYMLNIKIIELNELNIKYLIGIILLSTLLIIIIILNYRYNNIMLDMHNFNSSYSNDNEYTNYYQLLYNISNLNIISMILYHYQYLLFIIISFILLLAMIGVIILTCKRTYYLKEQIIFEQTKRFIRTK